MRGLNVAKSLVNLLNNITDAVIPDCIVTGIKQDSRQIAPGDLFLAYKGFQHDGRVFIEQAYQEGAVAVIYDPAGFDDIVIPSSLIAIPLPELHRFIGMIASRFYDEPSESLYVTGVTGTNGKTTIAYQLTMADSYLNESSRYIGTLGEGRLESLKPLLNTTPDALIVQRLCRQYVNEGAKSLNMEVSSHALALNRVDELLFSQAIYTNLTHDHLDFHPTMDDYAKAKALLFSRPELTSAIINADDPYTSLMTKAIKPNVEVFTYGIKNEADIKATNVVSTLKGNSVTVSSPWGDVNLSLKTLGEFNIYNSLAVFGSLMARGFYSDDVVSAMAKLTPCLGRMEIIHQEPYVIIDYAHTPDALENVLRTLKPLKQGKLILVFGCGGDRDTVKRAMMGAVAEKYADLLFVTSDNPRSEPPLTIINDIMKGIKNTEKVTIMERRDEAIRYALGFCAPEDILVIAGKGHEQYQQIGAVKYPFSDKAEVLDSLSMLQKL